jgi:hypothetical protein
MPRKSPLEPRETPEPWLATHPPSSSTATSTLRRVRQPPCVTQTPPIPYAS